MQFTDRIRSAQTVRIVKLYKPLSEIRQGNILIVLNEMQFTDRIRTEKCLYDVFSDHDSFSNRTDREAVFQTVSVCLYWTTLMRTPQSRFELCI